MITRFLPVILVLVFFGFVAGCSDCPVCKSRDAGVYSQASDIDGDTDVDGSSDHDPLDRFFSLDAVHQIEIQVDEYGASSLREAPRNYVHATLEIDGVHYEDVGVRLKGGAGSFVPLGGDYPEVSGDGNGNPGKSAFIIDFNRFIKGENYLGLKKLTINNMVQDPSCIHEVLGYALFREGNVPASRSGFASVIFNHEEKGLYALIESPDNDGFLNRWFKTDKGTLYEGAYGADLRPDSAEWYDQDNGEDRSKMDLEALADALTVIDSEDSALSLLGTHFDLDEYLTFAATEIYLGHWDGYTMSANNYFIHHHPSGKWTFVPWGIDQLFEDPMGRFNGVMKSPGPSWEPGGGRIHGICFLSQECRSRLHLAFLELFDRVDDMQFLTMAAAARQLVEPLAIAESTEHGDPNRTIEALNQVTRFVKERRQAIEAWLPCLIGNMVDNDEDHYNGCTSDCDDFNSDIHPEAIEECNFVDDNCNQVLDDPPNCPKCLDIEGPLGARYAFCFEPLTWVEAAGFCQSRGQELASIHNEETWEFLTFGMMEQIDIEFSWIGLNDQDTEGVFTWTDGSPINYEHWAPECPKPWGEAEDCVVNRPWGWEDISCQEPNSFICRTPE